MAIRELFPVPTGPATPSRRARRLTAGLDGLLIRVNTCSIWLMVLPDRQIRQ
jgi:hypothetical protein